MTTATPTPQPGWFDSLDWGTVPDWLAAIGTIGAFFWALRLFKGERDDRERQDAEAFVGWADSSDIFQDRQKNKKLPENYSQVNVKIRNVGQRPIECGHLHIFENGKISTFRTGPSDVFTYNPGDSATYFSKCRTQWAKYQVYVDFRDSRGRWWVRDLSSGELLTGKELRKKGIKFAGSISDELPRG